MKQLRFIKEKHGAMQDDVVRLAILYKGEKTGEIRFDISGYAETENAKKVMNQIVQRLYLDSNSPIDDNKITLSKTK